ECAPAPRYARAARAHRLRPQHQVRKVDVPGMRWHVRTLGHEAHVAQVAVIHDLPEHPPLDARDFALRGSVHRVEQRGKGVAQAEAAAAAVADVEHAREFALERAHVVERRVAPLQRVPGGGLEAPLACAQMLSRAFWKRLACERSALASVSNQSAISPKPSSRAAFAMPGYMSVYSRSEEHTSELQSLAYLVCRL